MQNTVKIFSFILAVRNVEPTEAANPWTRGVHHKDKRKHVGNLLEENGGKSFYSEESESGSGSSEDSSSSSSSSSGSESDDESETETGSGRPKGKSL